VLYAAIHRNEGHPPSTFKELFENAQIGQTTPACKSFSNFINMIKEFFQWFGKFIQSGFTEKFPKKPEETEVEMDVIYHATPEEKAKEVEVKLFEIATNELKDFKKNGALFNTTDFAATDFEAREKLPSYMTALLIVTCEFLEKKELKELLIKIVQKKQEIARLEEKKEPTEKAKEELEKLRQLTKSFNLNKSYFETREKLLEAYLNVNPQQPVRYNKK
jgi:hypothetical protein